MATRQSPRSSTSPSSRWSASPATRCSPACSRAASTRAPTAARRGSRRRPTAACRLTTRSTASPKRCRASSTPPAAAASTSASDAGSTWTRVSDGLPSVASPITTWQYPQRPDMLFTSTGSNGIYRSPPPACTWSRDQRRPRRGPRARLPDLPRRRGRAPLRRHRGRACGTRSTATRSTRRRRRWGAVTKDGLANSVATNYIMWSLTTPVIPSAGALGLIAGTQSDGGFFLAFEPPDSECPEDTAERHAQVPAGDRRDPAGRQRDQRDHGQVDRHRDHRVRLPVAEVHVDRSRRCADIPDAEEPDLPRPGGRDRAQPNLRYRIEITATNPAPTFDGVKRYSLLSPEVVANAANYPARSRPARRPSASTTPGRRPTRRSATRCSPSTASRPARTRTAGSTRRRPSRSSSSGCAARRVRHRLQRDPRRRPAALHSSRRRTAPACMKVRVTGAERVRDPRTHVGRLLRRRVLPGRDR